jgi:Uma2 family endonuclease
MSTAFANTAMTWESLLQTWRELEVPEGWRPELTPCGICMTPPPDGSHNLIADLIQDVLRSSRPGGCGVFETQGIGVALVGSIYVPDLCVAPRAAVPHSSDPLPSEDVLLAVEITSHGNAHHDRKKKKWAYAHGGIAQYLLVDRYDDDGPAATLFTQPEDGVYRKSVRAAFGQSIRLDEPFDTDLDTSSFAEAR